MVGDAAAGKTGADATSAIESAYARVNDWAREEARSRLPAEESLFVAEAKLYLRARGVASKITAEIRSRADAEIETLLAIPLYLHDRFGGVIVCANRSGGFEEVGDELLLALGGQGHGRRHRPGAAGQCFPLDPALVGPDPPRPAWGGRS